MSARDETNFDDGDAVRRASERIERLLGELRSTIAPASFRRVEELVSALTSIYGAGFERVLATFGDEGSVTDGVRTRLCDDPLIASLLILHGLHPVSLHRRVAHGIDRVVRAVGEGAGDVEIASIDEARTLKLRLSPGTWASCAAPRAAVENALRHAVEEAAPDVARIEIEGAPELGAARSDSGLVQIDLLRSRGSVRESSA